MWRTDIHWQVVKFACFMRNGMQPVEGWVYKRQLNASVYEVQGLLIST